MMLWIILSKKEKKNIKNWRRSLERFKPAPYICQEKKQRKQARKRNWFTLLQIRYWFTGKKIFPSVLPKAVFTKVKVFTTHLCSWHRIEAPRTTYSEFLQKNFLNTQKRSKYCKKIQVKSLKNSSGGVFFCWVSSFSNKYFAYL